MPTTVCLTTSAELRLKRLMSGVITAPTMKPPVTMVVPSSSDSGGPAGWAEVSAPRSCRASSTAMDQPASTRNAGTVT